MNETATDNFVPPYISFAQLDNILDRMATEGVPARIDRSYLGSWSGSSQGHFLKAAQSLGLRDEHGRPTELLKQLVENKEGRPEIIGGILREKYPEALRLGQDATQQQLDEVFREAYGLSGSTSRKAITFYLHATKFAGIPTSPFFKTPRQGTGGSGARNGSRPRNTRRAPTTQEPAPPPAPPDPLGGLHPAIATLVQSLPSFTDPTDKPEFSTAERNAWFAYAEATFNLIYARPEGDTG